MAEILQSYVADSARGTNRSVRALGGRIGLTSNICRSQLRCRSRSCGWVGMSYVSSSVPCMKITADVAVVVLTDRVGRVLMQHRGHDKRAEPGRWGPPCGLVEPGEDALTAAHRELLEETGLTAALEFCRVVDQARADGTGVRFHVYEGSTDARQEDVVLGEGLAMQFLTREEMKTRELVSNVRALFGQE